MLGAVSMAADPTEFPQPPEHDSTKIAEIVSEEPGLLSRQG